MKQAAYYSFTSYMWHFNKATRKTMILLNFKMNEKGKKQWSLPIYASFALLV